MLTVVRLGLPRDLRRSLACTNVIENARGSVRRVTASGKRWRDAGMAMRWTATGRLEANRNFRRLKAHKQPPVLRVRLKQHCRGREDIGLGQGRAAGRRASSMGALSDGCQHPPRLRPLRLMSGEQKCSNDPD